MVGYISLGHFVKGMFSAGSFLFCGAISIVCAMMRLILLLAFVCIALTQKKNFNGHRLISVHARTRDDLEALEVLQDSEEFEELDFWTEPSLVRSTDIRVSPNDYGNLRAALDETGLTYAVIKENIQEFVDSETKSATRVIRSSAVCNVTHDYCSYAQIESYLLMLPREYRTRVVIDVIGVSYEGRNIYAAKIASDLDNPKPAIWVEAGTHAREWIGIATAMNLIDQLVKQESEHVYIMLAAFDWHVVPMHNPDGYEYSRVYDRMWRKNRQPCLGDIGTDLNRNWAVAWGSASTSKNCSSDIYGGSKAFSAPETAALRDAVLGTNNVLAFFSFHSYSQLMLVPYGYTARKPERYNELFNVANCMMRWLKVVDGQDFLVGTPPDLFYKASGGSYDFFYDNRRSIGLRWSYTYELRPASAAEGGFVLAREKIPLSALEVIASLRSFVTHHSTAGKFC